MSSSKVENKRKLIYFWGYVEWGGAQIFLLSIMKVAKADWEIIVVLPRDSHPTMISLLEQNDIAYEFLNNSLDMNTSPTFDGKMSRQLQRLRTEIEIFRHLLKYDLKNSILHAEITPWQSWILLTALSLRRANVFITMHNIMPRASVIREAIWKIRWQYCSRLPGIHLLTSNKDTKNRLKGWVSDRFFDDVEVTYTAVDPSEIAAATNVDFDKHAAREKYGIPPKSFVFLCVGQFIDRKGRWIFLEAAKQVAAIDATVSFVWLTPQLPDKSDTQRVSDFGLGDRLKIVLSADVGTERHSILSFFRIADAFALASLIEGLPIALLEAMAMGLASISTTINAIPEAITNEETGLLIETNDPIALRDAMVRLRNDEKLRNALLNAGRELALTEFDERRVAVIAIDKYKASFNRK